MIRRATREEKEWNENEQQRATKIMFFSVLSLNLRSAVIKIKRDFVVFLQSLCVLILSHQHIKVGLTLAQAHIKETHGVNRIYDFFVSFFLFLVFSFIVHQAKCKCRYSEVVVDTKITLRRKVGGKLLLVYTTRMDLKNLKSVFVIAEIGQNHQGDIQVAKDVIKLPECFNFNLINFS